MPRRVYLVFQVNAIRRNFLSLARVPKIRRALRTCSKNLVLYLKRARPNHHEIQAEILKVGTLLAGLRDKLPPREAAYSNRLSAWLDRRPTTPPDPGNFASGDLRDFAWNLYAELNGFDTALEQMEDDRMWR